MSALNYTLTRDELVTTVGEIKDSEFGYPFMYWLCEDKGTGYYELIPDQQLCPHCARQMFSDEVDETHGYLLESSMGYEPASNQCGHCGCDITEN